MEPRMLKAYIPTQGMTDKERWQYLTTHIQILLKTMVSMGVEVKDILWVLEECSFMSNYLSVLATENQTRKPYITNDNKNVWEK